MKLTTKGRYAVTAMIDLALHAKVEHIALVDVAARQGLSLAYLEQLFRSLRRAHLVESIRGAKGGYRLARSEKLISLADILIAAGEKINLSCGAGSTCSDHDPCLGHSIWTGLSSELYEFLHSKKLSDLARSKAVQTLATQQDIRQIGNIPIQIDSQQL